MVAVISEPTAMAADALSTAVFVLGAERGMDLVSQQGFRIASCRDVIPNKTSKPLFSVFAARLQGEGPTIEEPPLIVEGDDGRYSAEMLAIQSTRGFGPQGTNVIDDRRR